MIVIPAIDLKDGNCVRLYKGEEDTSHVVAEDAVSTALNFQKCGAKYIHMVDLDGAFSGVQKNIGIIEKVIKSVDVPVEVGGGIRDIESIERLVNIGVSRVILGTKAIEDEEFLKIALDRFKEKIAVGVDIKDGYVAVKGWTEVTSLEYISFSKKLEDMGVKTIIVTDISKDGTLEGPNFNILEELKNNVSMDIIASGGIRDIEHIKKLKDLDLYGAITGKAIYSGTLDLKEAILATSL